MKLRHDCVCRAGFDWFHSSRITPVSVITCRGRWLDDEFFKDAFHASQPVAFLFNNVCQLNQIEKVTNMDDFKIFRRATARGNRSGKLLNDPVKFYRPLLATWLIEMTLSLGWYRKPKTSRHRHYILEDESFAAITGIVVEMDPDDDTGHIIIIDGVVMVYSDAVCARELKVHLEKFRNQPMTDELSLLENICTLGRILGLNNAEMSILSFAAVMEIFPAFKLAISVASSETSQHHLAAIIALVRFLTSCK